MYEAEKISGKELRDTLHFEMLWDTSKIDLIIRKIYKKSLFLNCVLKRMKDKYSISIVLLKKKLLDKITKEIEVLSVTN